MMAVAKGTTKRDTHLSTMWRCSTQFRTSGMATALQQKRRKNTTLSLLSLSTYSQGTESVLTEPTALRGDLLRVDRVNFVRNLLWEKC
jgi:hypothetical protein